jgi:hypothetical protein
MQDFVSYFEVVKKNQSFFYFVITERLTIAFFHCLIFPSLVSLRQAACGQTSKMEAATSELYKTKMYTISHRSTISRYGIITLSVLVSSLYN